MTDAVGWELYRSLLGVLTMGSLSSAARQLGITQPTVGRHIAALEKRLGGALFVRTQSGWIPTELAHAIRPYTEGMKLTVAALERAAAGAGGGVRGVVRVTASEVIGTEVLPPIIACLRERYPVLRVELSLSNETRDLLRSHADIAVRMARPMQRLLIARRIGGISLGLHATAAYLKRHGTPTTLEQLQEHTLIGFDQAKPFVEMASETVAIYRRENFAIRCDSDPGRLALIRAGAGIGICQLSIARRDDLVQVLPMEFEYDMPAWIVMHRELRASERCRATFDALVAGLQEHTEIKKEGAAATS